MIIHTSKTIDPFDWEDVKEGVKVTHAEEIDGILSINKEQRKDENNGFSVDRNYRKIASIPMTTWIEWTRQHPELVSGDHELQQKLLSKLLRKDENKIFCTVDKGI